MTNTSLYTNILNPADTIYWEGHGSVYEWDTEHRPSHVCVYISLPLVGQFAAPCHNYLVIQWTEADNPIIVKQGICHA